jgi:putative transposase
VHKLVYDVETAPGDRDNVMFFGDSASEDSASFLVEMLMPGDDEGREREKVVASRGGTTRFDPERHCRRSIRLRGYDYSQSGLYFLTVCARQREPVLGEVIDGTMWLNEAGVVMQDAWEALPDRFRTIALDAFVVMPNHVHGIVVLGATVIAERGTGPVGALLAAPGVSHRHGRGGNEYSGIRGIATANECMASEDVASSDPTVGARGHGGDTRPPSLAVVMRAFKSLSGIAGNRAVGRVGAPFWQRNYYEHVIRNDASLSRIRRYIEANPANWIMDEENPETLSEVRREPDAPRMPDNFM